MARFPGDFLQKVRDNTNILDVVGSYVSLKKKGKRYWACCPFHQEKTPSFSVSPEDGLYYCFGCHAGGDVFSFVEKMENLSFTEAVERLAEAAHLELPQAEVSPEEKRRKQFNDELYHAMELAVVYFHNCKVIKPGVTTKELDRVAEEFIRDNGAVPTFKGFPNQYGDPFPASICTSVNEQVVHGIPSDNVVLKEGDVVSVDCGTYMNGFCGDSAYTFCVGEVDEEVRKLLKVTKEALYIGIQNAVQGKRLGDIGYAIQQHCESNSYGVVREFVGHGIGKDMHEDPQVPNYGKRGYGTMLKKGLCIAIEPMITLGNRQIVMERDGWTVRTRDCKYAAHFEHTIAVRSGEADILSSFKFIEEVLGDKAI